MAQEFKPRYSDQEVAEILDHAATTPVERPRARHPAGLTLAQVQEIGAEIGLPADRVAEAALAVARRPSAAVRPRRLFGRPRSVHRVVHLDRNFSDEAWGRFVVELREAFGAEGTVTSHGPLKSWTAPNVAVHVEPDGDGFRVRMQVTNVEVVEHALAGTALLLPAVTAGLALASGEITGAGVPVLATLGATLGALGAVVLAWAWRRLPKWARGRAATLDALAGRIGELVAPD